jgi:hypothetical protein
MNNSVQEDPASRDGPDTDFSLTLLLIWGPVAYQLYLLSVKRFPSLVPSGTELADLYEFGFFLGLAFICGCCRYARSKGYSTWWGLTGMLFYVGALILVFLPKRRP